MCPSPHIRRIRALVNALVLGYFVAFAYLIYVGVRIARFWSILPEQLRVTLEQVPIAAWLFAVAVMALHVTGTIQLSRMRRSSFYFYVAAFVCTIAQYLDYFGVGLPYATPLRPSQWIGLAIGALICGYTWYLRRINVLSRVRV
jgi:hypothetical protein